MLARVWSTVVNMATESPLIVRRTRLSRQRGGAEPQRGQMPVRMALGMIWPMMLQFHQIFLIMILILSWSLQEGPQMRRQAACPARAVGR